MRFRATPLLAASFAMALSTAVLADSRTDADAAYGRGDFAAGLELDRMSAANGDVRAMINLADAYVTGRGVEKDQAEALRWYLAAAEKGSDLTGAILGSPLKGSDEASAVEFSRSVVLDILADNNLWFPIVAPAGPGDDLYNKAARERRGMSFEPEALQAHLTEAMGAGSLQAVVSLAHFYQSEAQPRNPTEALRLFEVAAERGRADAMQRLGAMYLSAEMNSDGLRWLRAAVDAGDAEAAAYLGGIYESGRLVSRDTAEAFRFNLAAAERGRAQSQLAVAEAYHDGHGTERDFAKAAMWFQRAADAPRFGMSSFANYELAVMYFDGRGVPRDRAKAIELLRRASAANQAEAMDFLATLEILGVGTAVDPKDAVRLYDASWKFNRTNGMYNLGVVYANGLAGSPDPALAETWWQKASEAGDDYASARLKGSLDRSIAPDDLVLPEQIRNSYTYGSCIRTASTRGITPYNGVPDVTLLLVSSLQNEGGMASMDLRAVASDPDGDPLDYTYSIGEDVYSDLGNHVTLRTPVDESYVIWVRVSDGRGCTVARSLTVEAAETPRPAPPQKKASDVVLEADPPGVRCVHSGPFAEPREDTGQRNRAGSVSIEQVSSSRTPEGTLVRLRAVATDPDGDALVYIYDTLGGELSADGSEASWLLKDAGFSMVTVEVNDGHGCSLFGSFSTTIEH